MMAIPYDFFEKNLENYTNKLILANSCFTANAVKEAIGVDSKVLYPPIPSTFYTSENDYCKTGRDNLVVTTARFGQGKGVELIPVIASLTNPNTNFVLIGLAQDPNVVDNVKLIIKKLKLENRVKIITNASRKEIKNYLRKAKVYLHTTRMEHFGISIVEAMAMGCLPVVHDSGGTPEFVPDKYRYTTEYSAATIVEKAIYGWSEKESEIMRQIADRFSEANFEKRFIELFSDYAFSWSSYNNSYSK